MGRQTVTSGPGFASLVGLAQKGMGEYRKRRLEGESKTEDITQG